MPSIILAHMTVWKAVYRWKGSQFDTIYGAMFDQRWYNYVWLMAAL